VLILKINTDYLIYCDESCPLQYDGFETLVIGAIKCPYEKKDKIFNDLRELKIKHNINSHIETKWIKVSNSRIEYYKDLIDYCRRSSDIKIRLLITNDKNKLQCKENSHDYDSWYFKMYYFLLDKFTYNKSTYYMLYDQKDKYTKYNLNNVAKFLKISKKSAIMDYKFDFYIKQINSKESELLQALDIFLGAASHKLRYGNKSADHSLVKRELINYIETKYDQKLNFKTSLAKKNLNIFIWEQNYNENRRK
jgi:hypothetical protein